MAGRLPPSEASIKQSEASIKQSESQAQMDQANSKSKLSGPLSEALARQEVVRAETAAAELDAQRQEKLLEYH